MFFSVLLSILLFNYLLTQNFIFSQGYPFPNCTGDHEFTYHNTSCFKEIHLYNSHTGADTISCPSWRPRAKLASIHSQEENDFVKNVVLNEYGIIGKWWIGLYSVDDDGPPYNWTDGSKVDYYDPEMVDGSATGENYFYIFYENSYLFDRMWATDKNGFTKHMICRDFYPRCDGIDFREDSVCNGVGWCNDDDTCQCHNMTYFGQFCEKKTCNGIDALCSNRGSCNTDTGICLCDVEYTGNDCQYPVCDGISSINPSVCSNRGNCSSPDNCECNNGTTYFGQFCEKKTCNGIDALCSHRGSCDTDTGICLCVNGYIGNDCQYAVCNEILSNNQSVCSKHGNCVSPEKCECDDKWTGKFCQYPKCEVNICSSHGECIYNDTCLCETRYTGFLCDEFECYGVVQDNDTVCSNHGICIGFNDCDCLKNWEGEKCEVEQKSQLFIYYIIGGVSGGFVILICLIVIPLLILYFKYQKKAKTFDKIKDVEIVLAEQKIESSKQPGLLNFQFKKSLFTIGYDEIQLVELLYPGSANLYRAKFSDTDCCIKIFKTSLLVCSNQDDYKEIECELSIVSSVRNPNIVTCYGLCLDKSRVGIVFELCEGNLAEMMMKKRYSVKEKIKLLHQISLGMKYLHSKSIIHRDLKLQNILVDELGIIKITDFGLSKLVNDKNQDKTKGIGTSYYLAPEVYGSRKYDEKCDVYSFGIVIFCLFEETITPYKSYNLDNYAIEKRVFDDPNFRPIPSKPNNLFPKKILELMKTCWNSQTKQRPSFELIEKKIQKIVV